MYGGHITDDWDRRLCQVRRSGWTWRVISQYCNKVYGICLYLESYSIVLYQGTRVQQDITLTVILPSFGVVFRASGSY